MHIRKTSEADLDRVMEIYARARAFMAEHGNPHQWGPTSWPPKELIQSDIAAGKSYVCEHNGRVVGTFFYDQGRAVEPTYAHIEDGAWQSDAPYGVVHRIASSAEVPGVGTFCLRWAAQRCPHQRIDTHADNTVMQNLLCKLGYVLCGTIFVTEDSFPRMAYEKL